MSVEPFAPQVVAADSTGRADALIAKTSPYDAAIDIR